MSATLTAPTAVEQEQRLDLGNVSWEQYVTISDALPERPGLKIIYLDGRLTILTASREHDFYSEFMDDVIKAIALGSGLRLAPVGSATLRQEPKTAGVEADKAYYLGASAPRMKGPVNIDLTTQPPPDLAIEVEVTHRADVAMGVYGRLGVPEVWRFDVGRGQLTFWRRGDDGGYREVPRSGVMPTVEPADVLGQLRLAEELEWNDWIVQLNDWVRNALLPRLGG